MHSPKMAKFNTWRLILVFLINSIIWFSSLDDYNAQEGKHWRSRKVSMPFFSKKIGEEVEPLLPLPLEAPPPPPSDADASVFNVLDYGAKGDGSTDDTKAFAEAWAEACKVESSTLLVPSGFEFLVKPVSFSGTNCASNIIFQLDGMIIAPKSFSDYAKGLLQWLNFSNLKSFTIKGNGAIDGQGEIWWSDESTDSTTADSENGDLNGKKPKTKPTALRFYKSTDVTITGITIQNSQQCHLKFDDCTNIEVFNISTSSPADSPNTDGIHLQNSQNVVINNVNLACGDDCVSIQTGSSNIYIHDVNCGPGHGISIGGLGKDNTKACVSNVTVNNVVMQDTLTGVRIKTWQGGSGSVQGIVFTNIQVSKVKTPIIIDQYYCDRSNCKNMTTAVAITGVTYNNIRGTYTKEPVHLACSDSKPCKDINLRNIELKPDNKGKVKEPFCWNVYGKVMTDTVPLIDCLQDDGNSSYVDQTTSYSC